MAAIGQHRWVDAGALSVSGLERLVDRLPAEVRAQLKWSPLELRDALTAFLQSSQDEAALKDLVGLLVKQFHTIGSAFVSLAAHPELLRSGLEEAWRADAALLRQRIAPDAADAADWVMRAWIAVMDFSLSIMPVAAPEIPKQLATSDAESLAEPGSPLRAQALMMAAIESARHDGDADLISDLVFRAFDEVVRLLQELLRGGVHIDPYRNETLAERADRLDAYADHLRNALSDSDMRVLEQSRMRSLR